MVFLKLLYLLAAIGLCHTVPGYFIGRKLLQRPAHVFVAALGLSGIALYLFTWAIYVTGAPYALTYAYTASCALLCVLARRHLGDLIKDREVRPLLISLTLLAIWILLMLSVMRHFSGARWAGDPIEHYQRALFFLDRWDLARAVYGPYPIAARPPMMNIIEAFFLAQVGRDFARFEIISAVLNTLLFLPIAGLALDARRPRTVNATQSRRLVLLTAAACALSPWFAQNVTYGWTKLYATFYLLLGLWLYRGLFDDPAPPDRARRAPLAFLFFGAGCLVHQSIAIYAPIVGLHYLLLTFRRQVPWRQFATTAAASTLLMLTYLAWAAHHFGLRGALGSNTTVTEAARQSAGDLLHNYARNALHSVIPRVLWEPAIAWTDWLDQTSLAGVVRDYTMYLYQPAILLAWGAGGFPVVLWIAYAAVRRRKPSTPPFTGPTCEPSSSRTARPSERRFWLTFTLAGLLLGQLSNTSWADYYGGIAHVVWQPLVWLAVALLIARSTQMPRWLRGLWWLGMAIDAAWVLLQMYVQSRWLDETQLALALDPYRAGPLSKIAALTQTHLTSLRLTLLGTHLLPLQLPLLVILALVAIAWWILAGRLLLQRPTRAAPNFGNNPSPAAVPTVAGAPFPAQPPSGGET